MPTIDFGLRDISQQAQKLAGQLSISGVQPKLSVKFDKKLNTLVVVSEGGEYILKPQTAAFPDIPQNEQCCMDIAEELGVEVPPHCLIALKDNTLAYVVKRFDREKDTKIHQEDFAQILEANDKYRGSVEQIGRKLMEISAAPGYDAQLLFERVVLNFILANGDAHLKNYSISYTAAGIRLSPAYDIVCSRLVIPEEHDESAININGKKSDLFKSDFEKLAEYLKVPVKVRYEKFYRKFAVVKSLIVTSQLTKADQNKFLEIVRKRLGRLGLS